MHTYNIHTYINATYNYTNKYKNKHQLVINNHKNYLTTKRKRFSSFLKMVAAGRDKMSNGIEQIIGARYLIIITPLNKDHRVTYPQGKHFRP